MRKLMRFSRWTSPTIGKSFFKTTAITQTGQLFLQKALESYVYCVLGAQAQTRWRIVADGAKRLQTQEVFAKLVKDTVVQDDDSVLITNMQTAVKATNVVLNLAILPKLILIPSDLFLKKKIPWYNNTLTLATKTMKFGKNEGLNFDATVGTEGSEQSEETARSELTEGREESKAKTTTQSSEPSLAAMRASLRSVSDLNKVNKDLGVVFAVLAVVGAVGAWLW